MAANLIYSIVAVNCYGIVFAITTFFCFSVVRIFEVIVRLTSEVKQAEQQKETIVRILSCLCDAFVQINGELRIESASKALAAMLFMQGLGGPTVDYFGRLLTGRFLHQNVRKDPCKDA